MRPEAKSRRSDAGGYMSHDVLADLLNNSSESSTPEAAAERAANRIIEALRDTRKNESKVTKVLDSQA